MISNARPGRRSQVTVNRNGLIHCVFFAIAAAMASPAAADETARVSRLESEIQQLRAQIDEQNRRIQRLEAELARRPGAAALPDAPKPAARDERARLASSTGPQAWHSPAPWNRVAKGMNADEVIAILGEPTSVESVDALKTLFYRGTNAAGTGVRGIVNLRDDRVVAVVKPVF